MALTRLLGAKVRRKEDLRLLTGRGKFTADIHLSGTGYAFFVRSMRAHARIKSVDVSDALSVEGVIAALTGQDVKDALGAVPTAWQIPGADLKVPRYMPLAVDRVRYVGDPYAVVVASSPYVAADAAERIKAEFEPLPSVTNPEKAVQPEAPQLYEDAPNNTAFVWRASGGDVDEVFSRADVLVKQRLFINRLQPTPIETRGVLAVYDRYAEKATVYITSQFPHVHRLLLSAITGIPEHRLRVVSYDVGGGFGSKGHCYGSEAVVLYLAMRLGIPIKWIETREENFKSTIHARERVVYAEAAAARDCRVLGLRVKCYANLGAYLSTFAPGIASLVFGGTFPGPYTIQAISVEVVGALTNTAPVDAYRGAGIPEGTYVLERVMDLVARELNMDPADVRARNFIPRDTFPYHTPMGLTYDSGDYEKAFRKALELAEYWRWREEQERGRAAGRLIGVGLSSFVELSGLGPSAAMRAVGLSLGFWESAVVRVHPTGKVTVFTGGHPHGQGEETTFAQIVADKLGVSIEDIDVVHGDTDLIPFGLGTYGSRTAAVGGGAIALACDRIIEKGKKIAAHLLEVREEDVAFEAGKYYVKELPERQKSIQEVALAAYAAGANELPPGVEPGLEATAFYDPSNFTFPFGTHVCVVEVDPETGLVKILKYVAVDDCGYQINPMIVEGQIHGGVLQGLAQALYEDAVYDESGNLLTSTLADYLVPTAVEAPDMVTDFTVTPSPHNPLGVKGIGEAGTIASTSAVANAVLDALAHFGVRHVDIPLNPERIIRALRKL
ncbi:MAG: molybdopterin cofactor-binding domain-containing protein [Nitrososphaerota archaeon]